MKNSSINCDQRVVNKTTKPVQSTRRTSNRGESSFELFFSSVVIVVQCALLVVSQNGSSQNSFLRSRLQKSKAKFTSSLPS